MPIFYNTLSPTPTTKNTITSVATNYGVRDFLLNLNLLPIYPQISTSLNGSPKIGEPVLDTLVNNGSNVIPLNLPLETNGILFKDLNININTFQNSSSTANDLTNINYISAIPNVNFPNSNWPQGIQTYPTGANQDISDYGLLGKTIDAEFKKKNVIKNLYLDITKQIDMADFIDLNPLDASKQITGYLDQYGGLNLGGSGAIQAANVIGSVLNGQGLGFSKGGVVPNFDIRSSLAGRVLGAAGIINDTKLGMIGGQQLALALANNAAFNVQQEILGSLNVQDNILSLIKGDGFAGLRPSYKITIPSSTGGRILDTAGKILGFTIPRSYLDDSGSLFQTENGGAANIERANNMILNTGKGQIEALLTNIRATQYGTFAGGTDDPTNTTFRCGYAPAYANNKGEVQITDGILYAFEKDGKVIDLFGKENNSDIANISYNKDEMIRNSGFRSPEDLLFVGHRSNPGYNDRKISDIGFSWGASNNGLVNSDLDGNYSTIYGSKKSLLVKTQALFNSKGMLNVVTRKGDMNKDSSQIQTANGNGFSKGNAVMKADMFDLELGRYIGKKDATAEETYCRSWTTLDRYDQISKLVRSGVDGISSNMDSSEEFDGVGINGKVPYRFNTQGSILDGYGIPKIAPYITDIPTDPKKFMFSIENLAWHGKTVNLPKAERGPGDLLTGKKGRIMWFPPYNIQFSESSSVNWEATNFIGRGESIYTYNNTERSGNLSFQIIVDHPSYVNSFRGVNGPDDHYVNSFWAGCIDPDSKWGERLTVSERTDIVNTERLIPQEKVVPEECEPGPLTIYYPNDNTIIEPLYENGINTGSTTPIDYTVNKDGAGQGLGTYKADYTPGSHNDSKKANGEGWPDRYNYGLNYSLNGSSPAATDSISDVGSNGEKLFGYFDPNTDAYIIKHLTEICPHCVATITGYASEQGKLEYNKKLAKDRAIVIKEDVKKKWWPSIKAAFPKLKESDFDKRFKIGETKQLTSTGCKTCDGIPKEERIVKCPTDTLQCKLDRRASISFKFDKNLAAEDIAQPDPIKEKTTKKIQNKIIDRYYNESKYFEKLTDADPFVFDSFREKIRYFHPAFHSTTPEGLNSRLTFLLQCTRQGPTLETQGATNLAFGRPPVCILRIGDFYNTKIVMDNVSIDYEPLVWDLNPEGIGVQPMIANVSISFKFIGASSLMGPINKLQNALSFNYFANTQVYDPRADYITKEKPPEPPAPASPTTPVVDKVILNKAGSVIGTEADPTVLDEVVVKSGQKWFLREGEIDISKNAIVQLSEEINIEIDQGKAAEIANSPAAAPQPAPSATTVTATTATTIDDTAVMGCFGYEGAYKIDQSDPTDFAVDIVMSWNAKKDVKDPELNASHNAFVYVKNGSKEQVVLGHIRISPNSAGSLIFHNYDDKNGSKTGGGSDQIISFTGQQNKTFIKFEVNFNIDDATKGKFILDAWNATGGNGSPSMIKIEWQDANGGGMNAGFSHLYALKFPNET